MKCPEDLPNGTVIRVSIAIERVSGVRNRDFQSRLRRPGAYHEFPELPLKRMITRVSEITSLRSDRQGPKISTVGEFSIARSAKAGQAAVLGGTIPFCGEPTGLTYCE